MINQKIRETVTLNNGVEMPRIGLGTVFLKEEIMRDALRYGFYNIDTATDYSNDEINGEEEVGKAIRSSGLERKDVFVTTKLWNSSHGYENALKAFDYSLKTLGLDYIDLYLIHWPCPDFDDYIDTWKAFEKLYKDGLVRAIGVSNFFPEWLERIKQECEIIPAVDQVEYHPFFQQRHVYEYCRANGIQTEAFSPMCKGRVVTDPTLVRIGAKYGKTGPQVTARFLYQEEICFITKSSTLDHLKETVDIFDFALSEEDMAEIRALSSPEGRINMDPRTFHELMNLKDQIKAGKAKYAVK